MKMMVKKKYPEVLRVPRGTKTWSRVWYTKAFPHTVRCESALIARRKQPECVKLR
jgi:hypothetical protein